MYSWLVLGGLIVFTMCLFIIYKNSNTEGFLTQDPKSLLAQRQQLQFEEERRQNDLARVINPSTNHSPDAVDQSMRQALATSTNKTPSLQTLIMDNLGFGTTDGSKPQPWIEQTGMVQAKINFCESLPVNCDFSDPRMAECGFCHKDGKNSKGVKWKGGLYISSDDQIRANQLAVSSGQPAVYAPTVGFCAASNFTLVKENCEARQSQMECENTTALTAGGNCGQCYGSSGPLLFVGPKPKAFNAILNVSHPGAGGTKVTYGSANTVVNIAPSSKRILDPQTVSIVLVENASITIQVTGMPAVWCAWLSSDDGKRVISVDVGETSISPDKAIGVVGDKRSLVVTRAFATETKFPAYSATVPNTVMWYRRGTIPGIPVSAMYGTTDVLTKVLTMAIQNKNINVPADVGSSGSTLVVTMDNGRSYYTPDGSSLAAQKIFNQVTVGLTCPGTLADPYYQLDIQACPTGPMVHTPTGAGILGSNSCYNAEGAFNPTVFCLQELFAGAGGTSNGTLYPSTQAKANALVRNDAKGPSIEATSELLNDLGNKATYGTDRAGRPLSMSEFIDASQKMLGQTPANLCDGPNKNTGPHIPACLDSLWKKTNCTTGKLAPLNPDGTPNEENISNANDMGSVSAIEAYYQSISAAANNTSDFPAWSKAMANCYNANVVEPELNANSCKPLPGINIIEASYGKNCNGALKGNRTSMFQELTNGLYSFDYTYNYTQTGGDPAPGCGKTLVIDYKCDDGKPKTFTAPSEAGFNGVVNLLCPPPNSIGTMEADGLPPMLISVKIKDPNGAWIVLGQKDKYIVATSVNTAGSNLFGVILSWIGDLSKFKIKTYQDWIDMQNLGGIIPSRNYGNPKVTLL